MTPTAGQATEHIISSQRVQASLLGWRVCCDSCHLISGQSTTASDAMSATQASTCRLSFAMVCGPVIIKLRPVQQKQSLMFVKMRRQAILSNSDGGYDGASMIHHALQVLTIAFLTSPFISSGLTVAQTVIHSSVPSSIKHYYDCKHRRYSTHCALAVEKRDFTT